MMMMMMTSKSLRMMMKNKKCSHKRRKTKKIRSEPSFPVVFHKRQWCARSHFLKGVVLIWSDLGVMCSKSAPAPAKKAGRLCWSGSWRGSRCWSRTRRAQSLKCPEPLDRVPFLGFLNGLAIMTRNGRGRGCWLVSWEGEGFASKSMPDVFIVQVQVVIVYTSALAAINRLCSLGLEQP